MTAVAVSWGDKIRQAFGALAFEHSSEMLSPSRKQQVLSGAAQPVATSQPAQSSEMSPRKTLLVAFNEIMHMDLLEYAIDTAKKFNADIEFLSRLSHEEVHGKVSQHLDKHTVGWSVLNSEKDCVLDDVHSYSSEQSELLFVVTSHEDTLSKRYINEQPANSSHQAPWVVIRERERAA